ncbi:MAG: type IV-A pilus assembly ATPase PilB [Gammaproteobacteria bacterium]|nr:type IV-A pilus assembly ATPase PilB [Gammaproteobacteria bacterium]
MASANPVPPLSGLARKLVADQLMNAEAAAKAVAEAAKTKVTLVAYIAANNLVPSNDVMLAGSEEFGAPALDLDVMELENEVTSLVKDKLIKRHHALPIFKRGNRLYVAISDPTNIKALDEFRFATGINTEAVIVEEAKLIKAIEKAGEQQVDVMDASLLDDDLANLEIEGGEDEGDDHAGAADVDDAPVVKYVNKLLLDAINKGASDLHFEPYEKRYRVRYRTDGILEEVANPPLNLSAKIAARVKVMARMNLTERRLPQDGRIKMKLSKTRSIDFRVSTCPTLFGEKIVMRILDPSSAKMGIDALGYEPEQKQLYMDALSNPYGMILITGPTGSGKTVSLYTGVNILNTPDVNISTAEDPVEINLEGVNQVNVNESIGMTFAVALKAFLRQDPDVILVGEIRDLSTGEIAIKAAQTGHLVLSTLHTNDAPQTLTRLVNMGVAPFNIATSVSLIIAQRLARRLCKHCKKIEEVPEAALREEGFTDDQIKAGIKLYGPIGCDSCTKGYKGRVGIYQVMPVSDEMGRLIMDGATSINIADQARKEGIDDLRQSALKKVIQGLTSLEEANRVTKD